MDVDIPKDSYTANLLYYVTRKSINLDSRRLLIGEVHPEWLMRNSNRWYQTVKHNLSPQHRKSLEDSHFVDTSDAEVLRNFLRFRRRAEREELEVPVETQSDGDTTGRQSLEEPRMLTASLRPSTDRPSTDRPSMSTARGSERHSTSTAQGSDLLEPLFSLVTIDTETKQQELRHRITERPAKAVKKRIRKVIGEEQRFFHKSRGKILYLRRFLVQIRQTKDPLGLQLSPKHVQSTVLDRWREYTVVARYTGDVENPVAIYLYEVASRKRTDNAQKFERRWSWSMKHKILLNKHWNVSLYDPLDLVVILWSSAHTKEHNLTTPPEPVTYYLFLSQNSLWQTSWLYVLTNLTSSTDFDYCSVKLVGTGATVQIPIESILASFPKVPERSTVQYSQAIRPIASPSDVLEFLLQKVVEIYNKAEKKLHVAKNFFDPACKYGLARRNGDFLKFLSLEHSIHLIVGCVLDRHRVLEFRQKIPAVRPVVIENNTLVEPAPVEGLCWRLTTWKGRVRKQKIVTRTYLHSHDHMLFFMSPRKVQLPNIQLDGEDINLAHYMARLKGKNSTEAETEFRKVVENLPKVNVIEPFPLDENGDIAWMKDCADEKDFQLRDQYAAVENERKTKNIANSEGLVDMTTIENVRPLSTPTMFEIQFIENQNVMIRVACQESRDKWVEQLRLLAEFWKAHKRQDALHARAIHQANMQVLVDTNSNGASASSEFVSANAWTFNTLSFAQSRSVLRSGFLYTKSRKIDFFKPYYAVLTSTSLALFRIEYTYTKMVASSQTNTQYTRHAVYDLTTTYIYTGELTMDMLVNQKEYSYNKTNDGLPRAWKDGWVGEDSEQDCCFILWNDKRKAKSECQKGQYQGRIVCLARTRVERDLWVSSLQDVFTVLSRYRDPQGDKELYQSI